MRDSNKACTPHNRTLGSKDPLGVGNMGDGADFAESEGADAHLRSPHIPPGAALVGLDGDCLRHWPLARAAFRIVESLSGEQSRVFSNSTRAVQAPVHLIAF